MSLKESSDSVQWKIQIASQIKLCLLLSAFGFTSVLVRKLHYDYVEFPMGLQLGSKYIRSWESLQASHARGSFKNLGWKVIVGRITRKVKSNINKPSSIACALLVRITMNHLLRVVIESRAGGPTRPGRKLPAPREKQAFCQSFRLEIREDLENAQKNPSNFPPSCGIGWGSFSQNWCVEVPFLAHWTREFAQSSGLTDYFNLFQVSYVGMPVSSPDAGKHNQQWGIKITRAPLCWFGKASSPWDLRPHCWHVISGRFVDVNLQHTAPNSRHEGQGKIAQRACPLPSPAQARNNSKGEPPKKKLIGRCT